MGESKESRVDAEPGQYPSGDELSTEVVAVLADRGVRLSDIAEIVSHVQQPFHPDITLDECLASVEAVVAKREVQHAVLTGVALDILSEEGLLPEPLGGILTGDDPLYGVDEVLALSITNIYGTIGLTTFGYLDKCKVGIIGDLDGDKRRAGGGRVHTFLDDLVAAIAAAAAARFAHQQRP